MNKIAKYSTAILTLTAILLITGCGLTGEPRARMGHLPTATFGIIFLDPDNLGTHHYGFGGFDLGGIVYTCKAGHIDVDHVRGNIDNTRYILKKIRKLLAKNKTSFSFSISGEMSRHIIKFTYPQNWNEIVPAEKEKIIEEIIYDATAYIAFDATTFHEVQNWFNVHYAGFEYEFNSAFTWEDNYSNLLGITIAIEILKQGDHDFNKRVTQAIDAKLAELEVKPRSFAIAAADKMRGDWYTGDMIPDTKMKNFDIGLDGSVTPTLVPDLTPCDGNSVSLPAPNLASLEEHGFSFTHQIKPYVFEQGKMFKAINSKEIFPKQHYPLFLEYFKAEAEKLGYKYDE